MEDTTCEFTVLIPLMSGGVALGAKSLRCGGPGRPVPLDDDPSEVMVLCELHRFQANDPIWET